MQTEITILPVAPAHHSRPTPLEDLEQKDEKLETVHLAEGTDELVPDLEHSASLKADAMAGIHMEKQMSPWKSVKTYRAAFAWSMIASLSIIMESYDGNVATNFYALKAFNQKFGQWYPSIHQYQVSAKWQSALSLSGTLGNWVGYFYGAWIVDKIGYRKALMLNYVLIVPLIAIRVFAQNLWMILAVGIVQGVPNTVFSVAPMSYASEVCPVHLRVYLTGWVNCCWTLGGLFASIVTTATQGMGDRQISYRLPWATPWIWPIPLFTAMYLAPESPWWLIRKGRPEEALKSVRRLAPKLESLGAEETVAMMIRTNRDEEEFVASQKPSTWRECFTGVNRRRTLIGMMIFMSQNLTGFPFAGSPTYFFEQAGLTQSQSYKMVLGEKACLILSNGVAFALLTRFGRRPLWLTGLSVTLCGLLIIGGMSFAKTAGAKWGTVAAIYIWNMSYDAFLGPNCYAMVSEVSSTRLRAKSVALSKWSQSIVNTVGGVINPYMINPAAWNWKGKTAFFWVPFNASALVWAYFCLPELKGRSYWELDRLFERKVSARRFRQTEVEVVVGSEGTGDVI